MSSGRILVADDEPSVRESVGYALAQDGFDVDVAADGYEATEKVGGDGIPYDLLILDIMMPGPSGLDICRDVRGRSAVPIIVLTAKDAEVDKVVGLEVGADDYVTKPFSVRELLGRVRAQLRRRELDRGPLNGGALADRVRRRRARLRRPHLQPPPEGRARPAAPRAGRHRARRRLQVRRPGSLSPASGSSACGGMLCAP
jgi:two-component system response regulator RegX3